MSERVQKKCLRVYFTETDLFLEHPEHQFLEIKVNGEFWDNQLIGYEVKNFTLSSSKRMLAPLPSKKCVAHARFSSSKNWVWWKNRFACLKIVFRPLWCQLLLFLIATPWRLAPWRNSVLPVIRSVEAISSWFVMLSVTTTITTNPAETPRAKTTPWSLCLVSTSHSASSCSRKNYIRLYSRNASNNDILKLMSTHCDIRPYTIESILWMVLPMHVPSMLGYSKITKINHY